jgi:DDE superfamily endonuclease
MLPISLRRLLDAFAGCFTTPTFAVFHAMVLGLVVQAGQRTVCGMLTGAGLATSWSHDRAHRFFSTARWSVDQIGLTVFDLVLAHLVTDGCDLLLAVDDTAHRRRGKKVHGAGWIHDGSAPSRNKLAFGHRWVVVGVIVQVSFLSRPVCLPVLCRRWQGKGTASTVELAAQMITTLAARVPGRRVHVVADAAYHGTSLRDLPATVTWTTRLPRNAVLYQRAPAPTGRRGRPRLKGDRIGTPAQAAAACEWRTVSVARYGRVDTVSIATLDCLWYGVFGPLPVRMVLVRDRPGKPMLALITTDLVVTAADLVTRYAARWAIEVTFFDTRQILGVGQARNRTAQAVTRTWAFGMYVYTIVVLWYAVSGHRSQIVADRRIHAPWYLSKTDPSFADMLTALRRALIAASPFRGRA